MGARPLPPEWRPGARYAVGEHRTFKGVVVVCCKPHAAGPAASNPWDPARGQPVEHAAALWAPNGEVEAAKLATVCTGWGQRLRVCALLAAGRRQPA